MYYSIDRLTDLYAVCIADSDAQLLIPRSLIDGAISEGTLLRETEAGRFEPDPAQTQARRRALHTQAERLFAAGSAEK